MRDDFRWMIWACWWYWEYLPNVLDERSKDIQYSDGYVSWMITYVCVCVWIVVLIGSRDIMRHIRLSLPHSIYNVWMCTLRWYHECHMHMFGKTEYLKTGTDMIVSGCSSAYKSHSEFRWSCQHSEAATRGRCQIIWCICICACVCVCKCEYIKCDW